MQREPSHSILIPSPCSGRTDSAPCPMRIHLVTCATPRIRLFLRRMRFALFSFSTQHSFRLFRHLR